MCLLHSKTINKEMEKTIDEHVPTGVPEIVCNCAVGVAFLDNLKTFKPILPAKVLENKRRVIGKWEDSTVIMDPLMNYNDLRLLDNAGNLLVDLGALGFVPTDIS